MAIAVLFDLEETLIQTPWSNHQHVLEFRANTRQQLIKLGIPTSLLEGIERATIMRNEASDYVEQHFSKAEIVRFNREMEKFLCHYEQDSAIQSKLFSQTIPMLKTLREMGARIGLVTNTSKKPVKTIFQKHHLESYFDVIVTREDVEKLKPDPEGILLAVKKLGVTRSFMVGDLAVDVLAAKSVNIPAILVSRHPEKSKPQDLLKSLPAEVLEKARRSITETGSLQVDYVVQSLAEIPAIIQADERKNHYTPDK